MTGSAEGFVFTMHEGMYEQEVKSQSCRAEGLDVLFAKALVHYENKAWLIGRNHDYDMPFLISPYECCFFNLKGKYGTQSKSQYTR